jgi:hypothetical protein
MFYVLLVVIVAVVTAAMTKEFPATRTRIGVISLVLALVGVIIGVTTGNVAAFYGGAMVLAYGMVVLLARVVGAAFDRGDSPLYRHK